MTIGTSLYMLLMFWLHRNHYDLMQLLSNKLTDSLFVFTICHQPNLPTHPAFMNIFLRKLKLGQVSILEQDFDHDIIALRYCRRVFRFYYYILLTTYFLSMVKVISAQSLPEAQNLIHKFSLNGDDKTQFVPVKFTQKNCICNYGILTDNNQYSLQLTAV